MALSLIQNQLQTLQVSEIISKEMEQEDLTEQMMGSTIAEPIMLKDPELESKAIAHLNLTVAILTVLQVVLMVITWLAIASLFSGKPPNSYRRMMEQAPDSLQEIFRKDQQEKRCGNARVIATGTLLGLAQALKLVYFGLILVSLERDLTTMIDFTNLFQISSLGCLLGAFIAEVYYYFLTHMTIQSQAQQQPASELTKRQTQLGEVIICVVVFIVLVYAALDFTAYSTHQKDKKDPTWTIKDELVADMMLDISISCMIAAMYLCLMVSFIFIIRLILADLRRFYAQRYQQFGTTLRACAVWSATATGLIALRLLLEGMVHYNYAGLLQKLLDGLGDAPFLVIWSLSVFCTEFLAQAAVAICLRQRNRIWMERLNIFPLGLPDGVKPPEAELLKALKEEIAKNGFSQSLLEESDIVSVSRAKNLLWADGGEDNFAFSDSASSLQNTSAMARRKSPSSLPHILRQQSQSTEGPLGGRRRTCRLPPHAGSDLLPADEAVDDPADCTATFTASKVNSKVFIGKESDAFKLNMTKSGVKAEDDEEDRRIVQNLEASMRSMRKGRAASKSLVDLPRKPTAAELNMFAAQRERRGEIVMGDDSWDVGTASDERMLVGSADLQSIVRAAEMDSGEAMHNLDSLVINSRRMDNHLPEHRNHHSAQEQLIKSHDCGIQPSTESSELQQTDMMLPVRGGGNFEQNKQASSQKISSLPLRFD